MNFSSLDYFVALVQEKNYTRAAERLHITQQTLSAHIAQLERELGSPLVIRHVPLEFTWAGQVFYRHALRMRQDADTMRKAMADAAEERTGILRLGIAPNRDQAIFPAIFSRYTKRFPGVRIELTEDINRSLIDRLAEGSLDLIMAHYEEVRLGIVSEAFYTASMVLLIPVVLLKELCEKENMEYASVVKLMKSGKRGCLSPLRECPFLLSGAGTVPGRLARSLLAEADIEPFIRIASDNLRLQVALCLQGIGAMFCTENIVERDIPPERREEIVEIPLAHRDSQISFCYHEGLENWKPLTAFIEETREVMHGIEE